MPAVLKNAIVSVQLLSLMLLVVACAGESIWENQEADVGFVTGQTLWPKASLPRELNEASCVVPSANRDFFWVHNDSGDAPVLYAIDGHGQPYPDASRWRTVISGARALDWEDIAADGKGMLYIGDIGNNLNLRSEIVVYRVPEPGIGAQNSEQALRYRFRYPEQEQFPPRTMNFDSEALFCLQGKLYLLTKHHSDRDSVLYHLPLERPDECVNAERLLRIKEMGKVTAACVSPDGQTLAVLTLNAVWFIEDLFGERPRVRKLAFRARQCEALTYEDASSLLMLNEFRELFRLSVDAAKPAFLLIERF